MALPNIKVRHLTLVLACLCTLPNLARGDDAILLQSRCQKDELTRVTVSLELDGTLKPSADTKVPALPLNVHGQFAYDERRLDDCSKLSNRRSIRFYRDAQARIKLGKLTDSPTLRDVQRLIAVSQTKTGTHLTAPRGPLTRDELDLIDLPANSLLLDDLLPGANKKPGDSWTIDHGAMAGLLGLDAVAASDVRCELAPLRDRLADIKITGEVQGAIGGVSTELHLDGTARFDVERGRLTALHLTIREKRSVGFVSPGLDVTAELNIEIAPLAGSDQLTTAVVNEGLRAQKDSDDAPQPLLLHSAAGQFQLCYDRRWHVTREDAAVVVLRLVDRGELVAQCNISPLPDLPGAEPTSLEQFQEDVEKSLGSHFGQFLTAAEGKSASGLRLLKLVVSGKASDVPIQWRYYLATDHHGRRVAVAFTMEDKLVERFADADAALIDSLDFLAVSSGTHAPEQSPPQPPDDNGSD